MRAVLVSEHGGPEMLQITDVPVAQPGPGQLLVEVAAAGVNFADIYAREGRYPYAGQLPFVLGQEGAGTVIATGAGTEFAAGDRVAWTGAAGCYSEQALVAAASAVPVPDGIELGTAAAVLLQGMTAHYLCFSTYPVSQDDPVVVHAAAGGVGLLLTQLVKMRGGTVVATTSSPATASLTAAGRPWCTTASGRPHSRPAWRRCAGAATWCCMARPAGRCRRSTCSG
jgi:NADPH2:quinone reductase